MTHPYQQSMAPPGRRRASTMETGSATWAELTKSHDTESGTSSLATTPSSTPRVLPSLGDSRMFSPANNTPQGSGRAHPDHSWYMKYARNVKGGCENELQTDLRMPFTVIDGVETRPSRTVSAPNLLTPTRDDNVHKLFGNTPSPRTLKILEIKNWKRPWETKTKGYIRGRPSQARVSLASPSPSPPSASQSPSQSVEGRKISRPRLQLKLEDMPTTQEAEDLAQHAANKSMRRRRQSEKINALRTQAINAAAAAAAAGGSAGTVAATAVTSSAKVIDGETGAGTVTGGPQSIANGSHEVTVSVTDLRLQLNSSNSSISDSEASPSTREPRKSIGSEWSPSAGQFRTRDIEISEAGISSPDATYLHLQQDLARIRELGRGASGVVHKAIHVPTLRIVAVKDVPAYGKGQRRQMVRELHALYANVVPIQGKRNRPARKTTLRTPSPPAEEKDPCPYIVSFHDAFVDKEKGCVSLVMEYMDMGSLQDLVLKGGCQTESVLARIADCILQGLAHIHSKKMIHRDIKPHNLLMNRLGDIKISDFGLARTLKDDAVKPKTFVGTLLYMAPERIGGGDYSYAADVWSFGLSLMAVALGKYPLPVQDGFFGLVDSVADDEMLRLPKGCFSLEFCDFIAQCLQRDPSKRLTAEALLQHSFLKTFEFRDHISDWLQFTETCGLTEDADRELEAVADVVFSHHFKNALTFTIQTQSDYGSSFASRLGSLAKRKVQIQPIQKALQIGLASSLGLPAEIVFEKFAKIAPPLSLSLLLIPFIYTVSVKASILLTDQSIQKREEYNEKLLVEQSNSPRSWTSSPAFASRPFNMTPSNRASTGRILYQEVHRRPSVWTRIREGIRKIHKPASSPFHWPRK